MSGSSPPSSTHPQVRKRPREGCDRLPHGSTRIVDLTGDDTDGSDDATYTWNAVTEMYEPDNYWKKVGRGTIAKPMVAIDLTGQPPSKKMKSEDGNGVDDCKDGPCFFKNADKKITQFIVVTTDEINGDNKTICLSGMQFLELLEPLTNWEKQFIQDLYSYKVQIEKYPDWCSALLQRVVEAGRELKEGEEYCDTNEENVPSFIVLLLTLTPSEEEKCCTPSSGEPDVLSLKQLYQGDQKTWSANLSTASLIRDLEKQEEKRELDSMPCTILVNYFVDNKLCTYEFSGSRLLKDILDSLNNKYINDEGNMYTLQGQRVEVCETHQATASIVRDFLYLNCRLLNKKAYQGNIATNFFYFPR